MHENEKCSVVSDSLRPHRLVHGILLARILEWVAVPFSRGHLTQESNQRLLHCRWILHQLNYQGSLGLLEWEGLSLLQWIFPIQESNQGLLCCRQILYQWSHPCIAFAINNIPHQVAHLLDLH